jgi:uncharacterized protein
MSGLRIDVADLLAHPGARRTVTLAETLDGLAAGAARVEAPVEAEVTLERIPEGILVRGRLRTRWSAECSSCLRELAQPLDVGVDELFEPDPVEGETYPIAGHELDLEQLVRDTVVLELPLAPHCVEACAPDAPVGVADEPDIDPRWAALSELEL